MNISIIENSVAKDAARRVLAAILSGDFDSRIPFAGLGLRWLRDYEVLSERPGWEERPVLLNSQGRHLARLWGCADV